MEHHVNGVGEAWGGREGGGDGGRKGGREGLKEGGREMLHTHIRPPPEVSICPLCQQLIVSIDT